MTLLFNASNRFIKVTPMVFGLFLVFAAAGEAIVSFVVARRLETMPMYMMYAETAANFIMIIAFGILYFLLRTYKTGFTSEEGMTAVDEEPLDEVAAAAAAAAAATGEGVKSGSKPSSSRQSEVKFRNSYLHSYK